MKRFRRRTAVVVGVLALGIAGSLSAVALGGALSAQSSAVYTVTDSDQVITIPGQVHDVTVPISTVTDTVTDTVTTTVTTTTPAPPPPQVFTLPKYGIATGSKILYRTDADRLSELSQEVAAGAKYIRFDDPVNSTVAGTVEQEAEAKGLKSILVLGGTASAPGPSGLTSWCGSEAAKYANDPNVAFEVLNEPDIHGFTGTTYTAVLNPCYDAIKAANPNAFVIAGALWKYGSNGTAKFVQEMYAAGAKGHFDALSVHLYDDPNWNSSSNIWYMVFGPNNPNVRGVMDSNGDSSIPIVATEAGAPATPAQYGVDETTQANRIAAQMDGVKSSKYPSLISMAVYSMRDDDYNSGDTGGGNGFGLLRMDLSQRPAYSKYTARALAQ